MIAEQKATLLWQGLNDCAQDDKEAAVTTVTHWLEHHGAGYPDVPLMQERARDDAIFWADCAHQFELEAYLSAILKTLPSSPITKRCIKKLAAMSWQRMDDEDRAAFKAWIERQEQ